MTDDFDSELNDIIGGDDDKKEQKKPKKQETVSQPQKPKKMAQEKSETKEPGQEMIAVDDVVLPERMVRTIEVIDDDELVELMDSIKDRGLLYPIIVTEDSVLVAGLRRYVAFKRLKKKEIPCITAAIDPNDVFETSLVENIQRKQLTGKQLGEASYYLLTERKKEYPTQTVLAKALAISNAKVTLALQEAGIKSGVSYEKSNLKSAKKKRVDTTEKKDKPVQEKFERIGEQHLPKELAVYVSKKNVELRVRIELPSKITSRFDVLSLTARSLKKVKTKELTKEIALAFEEM